MDVHPTGRITRIGSREHGYTPMALFRTRSAALFGIDAHLIDVEVDMYLGITRDIITVGLPDIAVKESPAKSVTINLAPANVRKEGAGFDLPMALGILGAMGMVGSAEQHLFVGELSLDGSIRPVRGALSIAACARKRGIKNLLVPADNAAEAAVADGVDVFGSLGPFNRNHAPQRRPPPVTEIHWISKTCAVRSLRNGRWR
jgi:magnesium chelatase family protein